MKRGQGRGNATITMKQLKYFSLFSGIGGFEIGIQQAYANLSDAKRQQQRGTAQNSTNTHKQRVAIQQPTCVGYSEIDYYATTIYQKHFNHKNYGDITKINEKILPDFDIIVGGFPCQSFSIAGKRGGFDDTRGTLFFEICRLIKEKQPRLMLLENVKGLLSHDNGRTFRTIISTLDELGYDIQWQVLNSKNHGVPQNRERVYIVGHLRGTPRPQVFPLTGTPSENSEEITSTTIDANYWKGPDNHGQRTMIVHNVYGGFKESKPRVFEKIAPTIRTAAGGGHVPDVLKGNTVRKLTPIECERLQAFPDNWTQTGVEYDPITGTDDVRGIYVPISDTQRYKTIGNAVTTNVIRDIMERILLSPTQGRSHIPTFEEEYGQKSAGEWECPLKGRMGQCSKVSECIHKK